MNPRFEHRAAFTVIGMGRNYTFAEAKAIPALWCEFLSQIHRIGLRQGKETYGVCHAPRNKKATWFHYTAAVRVDHGAAVPEGMEEIRMAAREYAVFIHKGPLTNLSETLAYIWKTWLPQSGMQVADAPDFELYGERWNDRLPGSELEIYLPVIR